MAGADETRVLLESACRTALVAVTLRACYPVVYRRGPENVWKEL